jgi:hypothetical protein
MNIAIVGACASGKSWLASALATHLPNDYVADAPPLMRALAHTSASAQHALQCLADEHRRHFDLTLLTGLDLACPADLQPRQQQEDAQLRATLQQTGIAYGVVYGSGHQRLLHALRLMTPQQSPPARWTGACEKCADPECEFKLFTALQSLKAAAHPAS